MSKESTVNLAQQMRDRLNSSAKAKWDKKKKKEGEFQPVAMNPLEAEELGAFTEFIKMKPYFKYAVGVNGWPCGGISQIIGKSDSGKSTMLIEGMVSCQNENGIVFLIDSECKFDWGRFEDNGGKSEDVVVLPVDSLEAAWDAWWDVCHQIRELRKENPNIKIMTVWDSVPSSVANAILEEDEAGKAHFAIEAKLNNKNVRKLKKIIKQSKVAAVFVNHSYMSKPANPMAQPEEIIKGGEELFFMSSLIIKLKKGKELTRQVTVNGETFQQKIGRKSYVTVMKGHLGGRNAIMEMNVCGPGMLTREEFKEYQASLRGKF